MSRFLAGPRHLMPALALGLALVLPVAVAAPPKGDPSVVKTDLLHNRPLSSGVDTNPQASRPDARTGPQRNSRAAVPAAPSQANAPAGSVTAAFPFDREKAFQSVQAVAVFALASFAPAAVLMLTAFVRINVVLVLLRQALGSPQVPGNQVLTALALLLTALVMRPEAESVYTRAIVPYANGASWTEAYRAASLPVKAFMVRQIENTHHEHYVWDLYALSAPETPGRPDPVYGEDFPMRVVAPAFLLSELTTALVIGFMVYLPFLVIDLVVAAVLNAMGMFMLPPSMVALPLKLILFVLADGWFRVAVMLLKGFGPVSAGAGP